MFRVCVLLSLLTLFAPSAYAQSDGDQPLIQRNPNGQWQIALRALGYGHSIQITGQIAERALFLPVPIGLTPHSLQSHLQVSPEVTSGSLEVSADNIPIASQDFARTATSIEIPLDQVRVRGEGFALTIRTRLRGADGACASALIGAWVELQDAVLLFDGNTQTPTTVGAFFPPILETFTVFTPATPTTTEAEAAARLAAAATRRYIGQTTRILFQTLTDRNILPAFSSASPFERAVVIREGADESLSVQPVGDTTILVLSGARDALLAQSRLLASQLATPLSAPSQEIATAQAIHANQMTFAALGWGSPRVTGVGRVNQQFTFAQADLGSAVSAITLRLIGTVSRSEDGQATVSILFNDVLVREENLQHTDTFDLNVPLPDLLVRRDNTLDVRFEFTPAAGTCADQPSFTGQISAGSYIEFQKGGVLASGFGRMPQTFLPAFQIAFEKLDADTLADAGSLVVALQKLTRTPLELSVVDWTSVVNSGKPALLIAVGAVDVASLNPPLLPEPTRLLAPDGKEQLRVEAGRSATVLQAFEIGSRDVLLLINQSNVAHAQNLANYIANDPLGWYGLQGDTLIYDGETPPFDLRLRGGTLRAEPLEPPLAVWWVQLQPFLCLAVLALILGALVWAYPRLVRRAPKV